MVTLALDQYSRDDSRPLDEFEAEWRSGSVPDVAAWLAAATSSPAGHLRDLIELDLEYRWRRYSTDGNALATDEHDFPAFPRLDDYVALLPGRRDSIVIPALIAEEYRVRRRWGDRPPRSDYATRYPLDQTLIEDALSRVDTEFHADGIVLETESVAHDSSVSISPGTTVTFYRPGGDVRAEPVAKPPVLKTIGRYRLLKVIGRGGFGEVWKAEDPQLGTHVAVKIPRPDRQFPPESLAKFHDEGRKLAAIRDIAGVVTVYDAGECDGRPFIVSKLVEGESLAQRLKRERPSHKESAELIAKVAEILHRAHLKGLVHRDIKPANILIDRQGHPHLADFGLAVTELEQLREGPGVVGTYAYMSPEMVRGESHLVDGRTDIYSLGVVLYECLTGRLPFVATRWEQYREQILHKEPRPLRMVDDTVPPDIERLCLRCLQRDPPKRQTSALDVAGDIQQYLNQKLVIGAHPSEISRRSALWKVAVPALGLSGIAGIGWALWPPVKRTANARRASRPEDNKPDHRLALQEILWSGRSTTTWRATASGREARIESTDIGLVSLGMYDKSDLNISVVLQQNNWPGRLGFFFGYVEDAGGPRLQYYTIEIVHWVPDHNLLATLRTVPRLSKATHSIRLASSKLDPFDGKAKPLRLDFKDRQLYAVSFAGKNLDGFVRQRMSELAHGSYPADCTGRFGLWSEKTIFLASDFTIDGKVKLLNKTQTL